VLKTIDLSKTLSRKRYDEELPGLQVRMRELHWECFQKRIPAILLFEGWDASGKGGAIKRLTQFLDPRGYSVIPIAAPAGDERRHHYLWRFYRHLPKAGHLTVFDRSWYGRVMVERVEGFCAEDAWRRAYREINEFEQHLTNFGAVLCKFWLHISPDEQLARFNQRAQDPYRAYKLTDEDWRNREKWDPYEGAVDELLERTSTSFAPWTVVEANDKLHARVKVLRTVVDALEAATRGPGVLKALCKAEKRLAKLAKG
jgi:polyphosphate kinase 2 (PPK2 family)